MPQTRLTNELRTALKHLVKERVRFPSQERHEKTLRNELFSVLDQHFRDRFKQSDMELLKKYELSGHFSFGSHEKLHLFDGRVVGTSFRHYFPGLDSDNMPVDWVAYESEPLVPLSRTQIHVIFTEAEPRSNGLKYTQIYDRWDHSRINLAAERKKIHQDFNSLIDNARTFEQVEKVWPEAMNLRSKYLRNLPVVVLDDAIARIAAHQRKQKRAEASIGGD